MTRRTGWREIHATLLERIRAGRFREDTPLPGEVALAREFGCARATVSRALQALAEEGIVMRRRRAGTFLSPTAPRAVRLAIPLLRDEVEASGAVYAYALLDWRVAPAPDWLVARAGFSPGASSLRLEALHRADGAPHCLETRWINLAAVPAARAEPFDTEGPNAWLLRHVPVGEAESAFSACAADVDAAARLGVEIGAPLFRTERATWSAGTPITWVRLLAGPGYRLTTRVGPA